MEDVYLEMLTWDFLNFSTRGNLGDVRVPDAFESVGEYTHTYRSLLMEELRAQLGQVLRIHSYLNAKL
jgi:hypothetical protein